MDQPRQPFSTFVPLLPGDGQSINIGSRTSPGSRTQTVESMKMTHSTLGLALLLALKLVSSTFAADPAHDNQPAFQALIRAGDRTQLERWLDAAPKSDPRDEFGNTPLMLAAVYSDLSSMQRLIERGADVHATNFAGADALMRAAFDADKAALLLKHGAKAKTRSVLGNTALMLAARTANSHRTVEMLLEHGADPAATNNWGATALMAAAAGGDVESVRLLLSHGAPVNAQPGASHESFVLGGGRSALMWAAFRGDTTTINVLLDAGADVNGVGLLGTPLSQAAWADQTEAARVLIARGADVNLAGPMDGYAPLHWAASTEQQNPELVRLLIGKGANPNLGGGENVDAFRGTPQTPLMLARRRGNAPVLEALRNAGATNETPDRVRAAQASSRELPAGADADAVMAAINRAIPLLQQTSLASKEAFVRHQTRQDCVSCHQQFLPMAALGSAKLIRGTVDLASEQRLIRMVQTGELKNAEVDWEALFHPDPVNTKGYALLAYAAEKLPADANTDSWVHHLAAIQGKDGQWYNNLPRPPMQSSDIGATALAIHALTHYPLPGRGAEMKARVDRARGWLWTVRPNNTEEQVYQILGLSWAGEAQAKLVPLAEALANDQRSNGGWSQLPGLAPDAYATAQALYTLQRTADPKRFEATLENGKRFLISEQLDDGTWHVRRRAFPFQPTMDSGFPHGRDSWISAAASSWAVMALSTSLYGNHLAATR